MKVRFLGQSCFEMSYGGKYLLFDPFVSANPLAGHISLDEIKADYILLTHGHADHVLDAEAIGRRTGAHIISNYEIQTWFEAKGIKGHPMNLGGKWNFDFGTVRYVQAVHSSTLPDGSSGGNPGGFVVSGGEKNFYFSGDTALTLDMQLIPRICPELDFCIFPIGDNFTMGYEDAVIASQFVECDTVIACHFDTFGFIKIDVEAAVKAFEEAGKNLIIPEIGQVLEL